MSKQIHNQNGFTLIEIIASITLLGTVVAVFLPIFPQIISWTEKAEDELTASNLLSEAAYQAKNSDIREITTESIGQCPIFTQEVPFYYYPAESPQFIAKVQVCEESNERVDLYRAKINIYDTENELVSETFTYIPSEEES